MSNMKRLDLEIQEAKSVNYLPLQYFYTTSNEMLIPRSQGYKFAFSPACKIASYDFSQRNEISLEIVKSPYGAEADVVPRRCITYSSFNDRSLMSSTDRDHLEECIEKAHSSFRQPVHLLKVAQANVTFFCGIWSAQDPSIKDLGIAIDSDTNSARLRSYATKSSRILD